MRGRLQPGEDLALRKKRTQIDDALEAIVEGQFEHAVNDRLGEHDMGKRFHSTDSIFS